MIARKHRWPLTVMQVGLLAWSGAAWAAGKVYVANEGADTVSVLDAASFKALASVRVGRMPHNVQVSPDGKVAWVTNNGEADQAVNASAHQGMAKGEHTAMAKAGAVWAIDTSSNAVIVKVTVGTHPAHVVVSSDGRFAYVTNGGDNTVSVIDTSAQRVVATIPSGRFPHGIRLSPDGKQAYVANLKGGTVSVIDTASQKEVAQIPAGKGPAQVGFTANGHLAFVSLSEENAVAFIDPVARKVIRKVAVGMVPIQLYATPDSRALLVANQGTRKRPDRTISMIDLENFSVTKTVVTGAGAHGVVVDRDGRYAYVTNTYVNTVSVLDLKKRKVVASIRVGKGPNGISVTP
ncbi:MAG: cytochrome D1 domain-containing protein [Polaromonas sp.]|uniref:YVTN family beta-propeller repeat protein n=1 Tax=Polaromonas sp. TaxID=1869339 RepID=UPI0027368671|nr:cytochrome D1 domain-containing protein [Polaromonas sp.]MDP3798112.1 cytochrome D1 domain-containing protein [Polaromonas sp.]